MIAALRSSFVGVLVLALLALVLVRHALRDAAGRTSRGFDWTLAGLLVVFVAAVVARFAQG